MSISAGLGSSALLPAGLGFRNVLINGDFKVWQRGTSKAMATSLGTGYLADRWTAARASYAAGGTVSRQTANLEGFQYCSRVQRDSGNTSTATTWYFQTLESVASIPLTSKTVTYSFYIRAGANLSGSVKAILYSGTATDQGNFPDSSITGSTTVITSTLSLTSSWQRIVLSGSVGSTATQLFAGFEWTPSGTAGSSDYFEITGVQLEQNTQVTPFEQRPFGIELALCQRYYEQSSVTPTLGNSQGSVWCSASDANALTGAFHFRVTKRTTTPTVTIYNTNTLGSGSLSEYTSASSGPGSFVTNRTASVYNAYENGFYVVSNGQLAAARMYNFTWTASSEL